MYMYVKVFGERNSGTIYLNALIRENTNAIIMDGDTKGKGGTLSGSNEFFPEAYTTDNDYLQDLDHFRMLQSDYGWKHAAPPVNTIEFSSHRDLTKLIFTAKHPVFWLKSIHKRPYNPRIKLELNFSDFIRSPWPLSKRDNISSESLPTPIDLFNRKISSYIEAIKQFPKNSVFIKYEDLLADTEGTVKIACEGILGFGGTAFKNVLRSTKSTEENFDFYKSKYLSDSYKDDISHEDLEFIQERLAPRVMRFCGYSVFPQHTTAIAS